MKKVLTSLALLSFLTIPAQGAFAWTYQGLQSLNPFTGFGLLSSSDTYYTYNYGDCKCKKRKLTKCEKLHGVKIRQGQPCGCAAPIMIEPVTCPNCKRAF